MLSLEGESERGQEGEALMLGGRMRCVLYELGEPARMEPSLLVFEGLINCAHMLTCLLTKHHLIISTIILRVNIGIYYC